jgi:hypothetical protein
MGRGEIGKGEMGRGRDGKGVKWQRGKMGRGKMGRGKMGINCPGMQPWYMVCEISSANYILHLNTNIKITWAFFTLVNFISLFTSSTIDPNSFGE